MAFDLQSDIPDRAHPDAFHAVLVQQTEALEALLHHAQGTMETLRANEDRSPQEQTTRVDGLAKEVSQRLFALDDQHRQQLAQLESFQHLLRRQGNSTLAHTVERVQEVLQANIAKAKEHMHAMVSRRA